MSSRDSEAFTIQSAHKTILENVDTLRTQRAGLVNDLSRMHDEVITLSKRLESIRVHGEQELAVITAEKTGSQKNIEELKQELSRLRNHIDGLDPVKRHLESSINDRHAQLERIESRLTESRTVAEEYANQIGQAKLLWNEVVRRTQDETKLLEQLREQTSHLEPNRKEAVELAGHIKRLKVEDSILIAAVDELRKAETDLRSKVAALTANLEAQKQREIEIMRYQHEADLVLAKTRLEHEVLATRSVEIRKDNEAYVEKTNELAARKAILERDIIDAQARLHQFEASLEPLRELALQREQELRRVDSEIADSRSNLKDLTMQVTEREKRIDTLSQRHDEILVENRRIETVVGNLHQQEAVYRKKIQDTQAESQKLESELNTARFSLGELNNEIIRNRAVNERFVTENGALQEAVTQIQGDLARLIAEKTKVISETERSLEKRLEAERERDVFVNKTHELQGHFEHLQREVETSSRSFQGNLEKNNELKTSIESMKTEIDRQQSVLVGLKHEKDATQMTLVETRKSLEEVKASVEALRNKQSELVTVQSRVRDLLRKEESIKANLANESRTEKAISERITKLEQQENQILTRIDSARGNLTQLEQNQRALSSTNSELQIKLDQVTKTCEEAIRKRESLMAIVAHESEAVRQARADLREIEEIKNTKLRELEAMNQGPRPVQRFRDAVAPDATASTDVQAAPVNPSQQVREDAEKTLESLRRHLDGILPKRDPSKG